MRILNWPCLAVICLGVQIAAAEENPQERALTQLQAEVNLLRRTIKERDQRIAELESQVKQLEARLSDARGPEAAKNDVLEAKVAALEAENAKLKRQMSEAAQARVTAEPTPLTPEAGIEVSAQTSQYGGREYGAHWRVTNKQSDVLEIKSVVYNGEYAAVPCKAGGSYVYTVFTSPKNFPMKLTIGESADFFQWTLGEIKGCPSYRKAIIYVDVDTNRGKFRYTTGRGQQDTGIPAPLPKFAMPDFGR